MESGDLRVFQAVAQEGTITKAAAKLSYVQSNVTARIRRLESELNTPLFYRHNRGMTLTASGKTLLAYAEKVLGLLDEAAKIVAYASHPAGPLVIGSHQTAVAVRLPGLLAAYHKRYPEVSLSLMTGPSPQLIEQVLRYELDGAFVTGPVEHDDLVQLPAFTEELAIVSEPGLERIDDTVHKPHLVLFSGRSCRNRLDLWLRANHRPQAQIMEFGTLEAILGGVAAGLGISLLPTTVTQRREQEGRLRTHALPEEFSRLETVFIRRKDTLPTSAMSELLAMLGIPASA
ncbi:LysR family transcriptional regulator [Paenibacillus sp. P26]|nr:LysR family transcriptional regulator [Paenibacillus sp. P26]